MRIPSSSNPASVIKNIDTEHEVSHVEEQNKNQIDAEQEKVQSIHGEQELIQQQEETLPSSPKKLLLGNDYLEKQRVGEINQSLDHKELVTVTPQEKINVASSSNGTVSKTALKEKKPIVSISEEETVRFNSLHKKAMDAVFTGEKSVEKRLLNILFLSKKNISIEEIRQTVLQELNDKTSTEIEGFLYFMSHTSKAAETALSQLFPDLKNYDQESVERACMKELMKEFLELFKIYQSECPNQLQNIISFYQNKEIDKQNERELESSNQKTSPSLPSSLEESPTILEEKKPQQKVIENEEKREKENASSSKVNQATSSTIQPARPFGERHYGALDKLIEEIRNQDIIDLICKESTQPINFKTILEAVTHVFGENNSRGGLFLRFMRHSSTYLATELHTHYTNKLNDIDPNLVEKALAVRYLNELMSLYLDLEISHPKELTHYSERGFV